MVHTDSKMGATPTSMSDFDTVKCILMHAFLKPALVVYADFKMGATPKFKSDFDKKLNVYIRLGYLKQLLWFIRISKWEKHPN